MRFSITSVMSVLFFSSISLVIINFIMKRERFIIKIGARFLLICLFLISLRLFVPFELPIARTLKINKILPDLYILLKRPVPLLFNMNLQSILAAIWLIGALIYIRKALCSYARLRKGIKSYEPVENPDLYLAVAKLTSNYKKKAHFHIVKTDNISSPYICGIFKPYIVIPNLELTNEEWFYVLSHEVAHHYNHDLFYKFACEMLLALYWWNPIIKILKEQLSSVLEINVDRKITRRMDELQKLEYLDCLIKIAGLLNNKRPQIWVTALYRGNKVTVSKRIRLLLNNKTGSVKESVSSFTIAVLLALAAIVLPNMVIMEAYGVSDDVENESIAIDNANAYFIVNSDNTYDFYIDNKYQGTFPNAFVESIPIYPSREEVQEND